MHSDCVPLLDFKHLRSGQVYRVRRTFLDAAGHEHHVGEEWTYLTHRVSDLGELVTLYVRDPEGYREEIPLQPDYDAADDLVRLLAHYLVRIPEIPEGHRFMCNCPLGRADWAEVFGSSDYRVVECFGCEMVVVTRPIPGGLQPIALDEEARAAVREVSALPARPLFFDLIHAAVLYRTFPANVMLGAMLSRRPNLEQEFAAALASTDPSERLVTLEFVSQMQQVPDGLEAGIVQALRSPLDPNPLGDEIRWALEALLNVADRVTDLRGQIAELRKTLRRSRGEVAARGRALVQAVLKKMDDHIRKAEQEREAAIAVMRKLAVDGAYGKAEEWLEQWATRHPQPRGIVARASLAEAAGDVVAESLEHPEAASWLYQQAISLFDEYAKGVTGGEADARGRHARRVARKLGAPPSSLPPPRERYALLSATNLTPPRGAARSSVPGSGRPPATHTESGIRADLLTPDVDLTGNGALAENNGAQAACTLPPVERASGRPPPSAATSGAGPAPRGLSGRPPPPPSQRMSQPPTSAGPVRPSTPAPSLDPPRPAPKK